MYSHYKDNAFTEKPIENNGKFGIYGMSAQGLEEYLSPNSYNYHYLSKFRDPNLMKEIEEEMKKEREEKNEKKVNFEEINQQNNINNVNLNNNNSNQNNNQYDYINKNIPYQQQQIYQEEKRINPINQNVNYSNNVKSQNKYLNKKPINQVKKNNMSNYNNKLINNQKKFSGNVMPKIANIKSEHGNLKNYPSPHFN